MLTFLNHFYLSIIHCVQCFYSLIFLIFFCRNISSELKKFFFFMTLSNLINSLFIIFIFSYIILCFLKFFYLSNTVFCSELINNTNTNEDINLKPSKIIKRTQVPFEASVFSKLELRLKKKIFEFLYKTNTSKLPINYDNLYCNKEKNNISLFFNNPFFFENKKSSYYLNLINCNLYDKLLNFFDSQKLDYYKSFNNDNFEKELKKVNDYLIVSYVNDVITNKCMDPIEKEFTLKIFSNLLAEKLNFENQSSRFIYLTESYSNHLNGSIGILSDLQLLYFDILNLIIPDFDNSSLLYKRTLVNSYIYNLLEFMNESSNSNLIVNKKSIWSESINSFINKEAFLNYPDYKDFVIELVVFDKHHFETQNVEKILNFKTKNLQNIENNIYKNFNQYQDLDQDRNFYETEKTIRSMDIFLFKKILLDLDNLQINKKLNLNDLNVDLKIDLIKILKKKFYFFK